MKETGDLWNFWIQTNNLELYAKIYANSNGLEMNLTKNISISSLAKGIIFVEISLAKGIIFTKIGLANGTILKLWAAHPYPKFSKERPPPWFSPWS